MSVQSTRKKNSKLSDTPAVKKDGYASGGPSNGVRGTKVAKPYSGPPVVRGSF